MTASSPAARPFAGLMFRDHALFPHLGVLDKVRFGLNRRSRAKAREIALTPDPRLLLLNEPFSGILPFVSALKSGPAAKHQ